MGGIQDDTPMNRPIHFEIPHERAMKFTKKYLVWKLERWDGPMEF